MIGDAFHRIGRSLLHLRRGNVAGALQALESNPNVRRRGNFRPTGSLASDWLALQYGWKPAINDVHYGMMALSKFDLEDVAVANVRSSATSHDVKSASLRPNAAGSPPVVGGYSIITRTRTSFQLRFRVQDHFRALMSQSGFTNPVSLAWELLPFSFVFDWALPVGSFFESLDQWGGLEFLDGRESTFTRMEAAYSKMYAGSDYPYGSQAVPTRYTTILGAYFENGILFDRVKLTSFPSKDFPLLKNPFSTAHVLNGIALIRAGLQFRH
jgi:hypothetical protein